MSQASRAEMILVLVLRCGGCLLLTAFLTILLPVSWMESTHAWLGLGEFPRSPLVDYLTRSIAALYGFHGALLLLVSMRVRRYRGIVVYLAYMDILFGLLMIAIDLHAGMPAYWTAVEGPPLVVIGVLLLSLLRSVPGE